MTEQQIISVLLLWNFKMNCFTVPAAKEANSKETFEQWFWNFPYLTAQPVSGKKMTGEGKHCGGMELDKSEDGVGWFTGVQGYGNF